MDGIATFCEPYAGRSEPYGGTFECAANRSGYVFSSYPACASGHVNYVATNSAEGMGCYHEGSGWGQSGRLWVR